MVSYINFKKAWPYLSLFKIVQAFLFICSFSISCFSQISINFPVERSVFQRVNNKGDIQINGQITTTVSKIEAKLTVISGGIMVDWIPIVGYSEIGSFRAQLQNIEAGWYKLELRAIYNNQPIGNIVEVSKVGIGEVFIIAGQSNAQGGRPPEGGYSMNLFYGALDDRVNCIDNYFSETTTVYPLPNITKINAETNIAPKGKASWCWALLGDKITTEWNVPVLFFNVAIGATKCSQWKNAAFGEPVIDHYSPIPNTVITTGWPYIDLKKSLQYYSKIFGIRAVIWHQGEDDMAYFDSHPSIFTNYVNNLKAVIQKSRENAGNNISWIIAKVSRVGDGLNYNLKLAQETVATEPNLNTFLGPDTDGIQPSYNLRDSGVHFGGTGFIELADAWFNSINNSNFIQNSNPIAGSNNLQVVNNQIVFGNSLAPCYGLNQTINSGDWQSSNIWSCGNVPTSLNDIIINAGHTITISNKTVWLKNIQLNGSINLENDGNILFVE
jgi:hypothetical protein